MGEVSLYPCNKEEVKKLGLAKRSFNKREALVLWVSGLYGHTRRQGYEASQVDSLKPRKNIHWRGTECALYRGDSWIRTRTAPRAVLCP
jgi:hypothetical protein